jgi:hypothetical protein
MLTRKKDKLKPRVYAMPMTSAKLTFYVLKVPLLLTLMFLGFMLDFFIQLPFHIMCKLDHVRGKRF